MTDTTAPSVPQNLTFMQKSLLGVLLAWDKSTDDMGVDHYVIYRNGSSIGTTQNWEGTSFVDGGSGFGLDSSVTYGVSYSYQVSAVDAAGNESAKSDAISATLAQEPAFPPAPTNVTIAGNTLFWDIDDSESLGMTFTVYRDGKPWNPTDGYGQFPTFNGYGQPGVVILGWHSYAVVATDAANLSSISDLIYGGLPMLTNALSADVTLASNGSYYDGPKVSQGTTGTWFVSGHVTVMSPNASENIGVKLWDGTTLIAETNFNVVSANYRTSVALSGFITSPAGDLRISVRNYSAGNGKIIYNDLGGAKDSVITALRVS